LKRSNRLILLIGVFLAIVAFVGIVIIFQGNRGGGPAAPVEPTSLPTVFATRDIALGTPITEDMLEQRDQAITQRDATAFGDESLLLGQIARKNIVAGKQLTADDFDVTGAPLTIDTPAGLRAYALQVDQVSGVGTLIRTGDYVDVVVGFSRFPLVTTDPTTGAVTVADPSQINPVSSKLLIQGMQVLGTLLPPPPAPAEGGEGTEGTNQGTALTGQQEILILGVTPQQAEILKYAQTEGAAVAVALRSPADFRDPDTQQPIVAPIAETTGITLRVLVDEHQVLIPQVIEAVLPDDAATPETP
jgi:pilus assembly protein CpaB